MDQVLLWLLHQGYPISLPHLMVLHMRNLPSSPGFFPYGLWLTKVFRAYAVVDDSSKRVSCRDVMGDGVLSKMEPCLMGGELLIFFLGFQPKEACVGCLKMQEQVGHVNKQLQQLLARDPARDRLVGQQHRQIMSTLSMLLKPPTP